MAHREQVASSGTEGGPPHVAVSGTPTATSTRLSQTTTNLVRTVYGSAAAPMAAAAQPRMIGERAVFIAKHAANKPCEDMAFAADVPRPHR